MLTEEQLNKLPKYVKDEIDKLNNRISELQKDLLVFSEKVPTNIVCVAQSGEKILLPKNSVIKFYFDNMNVDIYNDNNKLNIYGYSSFNILPMATNRIILSKENFNE